MEHIQQLTMSWLRAPGRAGKPPQQPAAPAELPGRDRVRKLAQIHHKQLVTEKQRSGSHYATLRAQTEALRQFTLELTPEQADAFMNMYTEESSAVEREWLSKQNSYRAPEPMNPMAVNVLAFLTTIAAIAAAIYYVV